MAVYFAPRKSSPSYLLLPSSVPTNDFATGRSFPGKRISRMDCRSMRSVFAVTFPLMDLITRTHDGAGNTPANPASNLRNLRRKRQVLPTRINRFANIIFFGSNFRSLCRHFLCFHFGSEIANIDRFAKESGQESAIDFRLNLRGLEIRARNAFVAFAFVRKKRLNFIFFLNMVTILNCRFAKTDLEHESIKRVLTFRLLNLLTVSFYLKFRPCVADIKRNEVKRRSI